MKKVKCHVCGFVGCSSDDLGWEHTCTDVLKGKLAEKDKELQAIKDRRKVASLNELMERSVKELAELVIDLIDEEKESVTEDKKDDLRIVKEARAVIHQCLIILPVENYPTEPCIIGVAQEIGYLEGKLEKQHKELK